MPNTETLVFGAVMGAIIGGFVTYALRKPEAFPWRLTRKVEVMISRFNYGLTRAEASRFENMLSFWLRGAGFTVINLSEREPKDVELELVVDKNGGVTVSHNQAPSSQTFTIDVLPVWGVAQINEDKDISWLARRRDASRLSRRIAWNLLECLNRNEPALVVVVPGSWPYPSQGANTDRGA